LRVRVLIVDGAAEQGCDVVVVTFDRLLRQRVAAPGGSRVGPSWLLTGTC
jgi:hypothetical protein